MFSYDECISVLLYSNNRGETLGVFLPQSYFPCISDVYVLEEEKGMNLCYRYIYILQLTVQILIDHDIRKPTIRQHCIMVQSIQIYPLLCYPLLLHLLASSDFTLPVKV